MSASLAPGLLIAFLLALVRAASWLVVAPPFNSAQIPATVKVGIAGGLALTIAPHLDPATVASPLVSTPAFIGSVLLQAVTGLALGYVSNLLFSAVTAAGSLIDLFGGFTLTAAMDPLNQQQTPIIGRSFSLIGTTLLFALNAHLLLIRGFVTSFKAVPLSGSSMHVLGSTILGDVGFFFLAALEIAAPLVAVLFLSDMALGLLSRAAPQLNIFSLGAGLKTMIVLVLIGTTLPLLPGAVTTLVDRGIRDGMGVLGIGA